MQFATATVDACPLLPAYMCNNLHIAPKFYGEKLVTPYF
jgi:hypothetical protein